MKKTKKAGYTLIEAMTVLLILLVLSAVTIPPIYAFLVRAEQSARDNTARTLFLSAQTALTNAYTSGNADAVCTVYQAVPDPENPDEGDPFLVYLVKRRGEPETGDLARLLAPYWTDRVALGETTLIEFDRVTGKVRAVFYSDKVTDLGYDTTSGYNVQNRDPKSLRAAKIGFFGVDEVSGGSTPSNLDGLTITLMDYVAQTAEGINHGENYGMLTAEALLPEGVSETAEVSFLLYPQHGEPVTVALKQTEIGDSLTQVLGGGAVAYAETDALTGRKRLVLPLDLPGYPISARYPTLQNGALRAAVTVRDGSSRKTAYSNVGDVFFGGVKDGKEQIASIRHLNNLREVPSGKFVQTADIAVTDYMGTKLNFKPIPFSGEYTGTGYQILDFNCTGVENAGLFSELSTGALVTGVTVWSGIIEGSMRAGGIVAYLNGGTVTGCLNAAQIISSDTAGGLVGEVGSGVLEKSYNAGAVSGVKVAGGVAGDCGGTVRACYNTGTVNTEIEYSEAKFAYVLKAQTNLTAVTGGIIGEVFLNGQVSDCYNIQYAGGSASGAFGAVSGTVTNCAFRRNVHNTSEAYALSGVELQAHVFAGMQAGDANGLGTYKYVFPYLAQEDVAIHRTPWQNVVEPIPEVDGLVFMTETPTQDMTTIHFLVDEDTVVNTIRVRILYTSGKVQTINLTPEQMANAAIGYEAAIAAGKSGYLTTGSGNAKRYPFYLAELPSREGYLEYAIVLLTEDLGNEGHNGLNKGPFRVEVTINGTVYLSDEYPGVF